MTDTPETQPVEGAEILKLLRKLDAQTRANGEALSKLAAGLTDVRTYTGDLAAAAAAHGKQLGEVSEHVSTVQKVVIDIGEVVAAAAPLLQSGPARALAGGRKVADYLKGGRRG